MGYLIDTYALIEWFRNHNPKYKRYFEDSKDKFISPLILMEFYFAVYHEFNEAKAEFLREILLKSYYMIRIKHSSLIEGAKFRSKMFKKKIKISYTDALNYVLAKQNNIKVLTGDEHFRNIDHVEFVK